MTRIFSILFSIALISFSACTGNQASGESQTAEAAIQAEDNTPQKMLRHVVLFKFKDTSSAESIDSIQNAFQALPDKIREIKDFEWGTDVSVENLQQGFTHCFFVTFENEAGRAIYLPHPDHQAFVELVSPHVDKVLVVDYFTQK